MSMVVSVYGCTCTDKNPGVAIPPDLNVSDSCSFFTFRMSSHRWVCVKDAKNPGDVRVWYRAEEGSSLHTIRCDYDMDAPLEYILVLLNEIALLEKATPYMPHVSEHQTQRAISQSSSSLFTTSRLKFPRAMRILLTSDAPLASAVDAFRGRQPPAVSSLSL